MEEAIHSELIQIEPQRVRSGDVCPSHAGQRPAPHETAQQAPQRLELEEVRAKLEAAKGPQYWRCLEELAGSQGFEEMLHREFPRQASEWVGGDVSRRNFVKLMSASLALAGMTGCTKLPVE